MTTTYADKSWKQNRFPELKPADGETAITRSAYDRWDGNTAGVFKAMKIPFVRPLADTLPFNDGKFQPLIPGTSADDVTQATFKKHVITMCCTAGHRFKNKDDNDPALSIDDSRFERNYEELTDIFDDIIIQLADKVQQANLDIVFKEERKNQSPADGYSYPTSYQGSSLQGTRAQ